MQEINRITRNEARKWRHQIINRAMKDPKGRAVLRVDIPTPTGTQTLDTKEEVEHHVQQNLQQCFSLDKRAPLNTGQLLEDFGTLGDTDATTRLFQGTYNFPSNIDEATADYLTQQHVSTGAVTVKEYISFWSTAKDDISSSKSGQHIGHYKAI